MNEEAFGWFSPQDFELLIDALHGRGESGSVVLVGGQAITAWALYYAVAVPVTDTPYLTQDSDFLASRDVARHLAAALGGSLRLADMDDHTVNVGTIVFRSPTSNQRLLIDILSCVYGLKDAEVRNLSVEVHWPHQRTLNVLHPLLCLESRIHNLAGLPGKRTPEGKAQARVAIEIVKRFLGEISENQRSLLKAIGRIARLARSRAGVKVFAEFGIDPLLAIDAQLVRNPRFLEQAWPVEVTKVERQRRLARERRGPAPRHPRA